jgi:hypothetical protein
MDRRSAVNSIRFLILVSPVEILSLKLSGNTKLRAHYLFRRNLEAEAYAADTLYFDFTSCVWCTRTCCVCLTYNIEIRKYGCAEPLSNFTLVQLVFGTFPLNSLQFYLVCNLIVLHSARASHRFMVVQIRLVAGNRAFCSVVCFGQFVSVCSAHGSCR